MKKLRLEKSNRQRERKWIELFFAESECSSKNLLWPSYIFSGGQDCQPPWVTSNL